MKGMVTALEMARARNIDPKDFRRALRAADFKWHRHNDRWEAPIGSPEHSDMQRVLLELVDRSPKRSKLEDTGLVREQSTLPTGSDEAWIIDLCDKVLGRQAIRQHCFPFLRGDAGQSGRRVPLPVDAYYPDLFLVIEYHERQHTSPVPFFDRRKTVSGVVRGEQRKRYDERRWEVLPKQGYQVIIFNYSEFKCTSRGRLIRDGDAERIVMERLKGF